jgi:hypothetical protein
MGNQLRRERAAELQRYIDQDRLYPSESKGIVEISGMEPVHAFNAYRNLRMRTLPNWPVVQTSPLAKALLAQAFDGRIPEFLVRTVEQPAKVSLEDVFDALEELDQIPAHHPVTRARIVHDHLTKEKHD